ncbi:MAG: DUF1800 family protein [Actinomycetota bacterium]|nr:DUF1800 family protein [Actinomycetota bacterium]
MNERDAVAWLHRRAGFGLPPDELRAAAARGPQAELDRLLDPDGAGAPATHDLWDDEQLPLDPRDREARLHAVLRWLELISTTEQPLVDRVAWLWHGHFVSSLDKVRVARLLVNQVRLFRAVGLGGFRDLLHDITLDPAMLIYLDLRDSNRIVPNENYSRELLELFTLGEGNYTEADVQAGAAALTGWTLRRGGAPGGGVRFVEAAHDGSQQTYLGATGVHDLDTVLDAVMGHDAMPGFIAATFASELLGSTDDDLVTALAGEFVAAGFDVRALVRATLQAGLDGAAAPLVLGPVPWFGIAGRVTGAAVAPRTVLRLLRGTGQLPLLPPNVAGWPGGTAWFAASSLVARSNLAAALAGATPAGEVLAAAAGDDLAVLADVLGLPAEGFGTDSSAALAATPAGRDRLAVALITPEFMIA